MMVHMAALNKVFFFHLYTQTARRTDFKNKKKAASRFYVRRHLTIHKLILASGFQSKTKNIEVSPKLC